MNAADVLRVVGMVCGPLLVAALIGLVAWIVRVEKGLACIERCKELYEHNIPDIWKKVDAIHERLAAIDKRLSIWSMPSASAGSAAADPAPHTRSAP